MSKKKVQFANNNNDDGDDNMDYEEPEEDEDEDEDEINIASSFMPERSLKPGIVVSKLIHNFGNLVNWQPKDDAIPDHRGKFREEDKVYEKLIRAPTCVIRVLQLLKSNENFENKLYTILIAKKKLVDTQLRPLLELCRQEDSITALRCCRLAIFLIKRMGEKATTALNSTQNARMTKSKEEKENEDEEQKANDGNNAQPDMKKEEDVEKIIKQQKLAAIAEQKFVLSNAKDQLSALISFKEALCTEHCNEAIVNIFRIAWSKEQIKSEIETKKEVAICISYVRRILAIEAHPDYSTAHEIKMCKITQCKYILQLRPILQVIPTICASLTISSSDNYHDAWLRDVILILSSILNDFDGKDLYKVYKENGILKSEQVDDLEADEVTIINNQSIDKKVLTDINIPDKLKGNKPMNTSNQQSTGQPRSLTNSLLTDRNKRLVNINSGYNSRLHGVYVKNNYMNNKDKNTTYNMLNQFKENYNGDNNTTSTNTNSSNVMKKKVVSDLFNTNTNSRLDINSKVNKKHLTFTTKNATSESINILDTIEGQKALIVVATILDNLITYDSKNVYSYPGIRQLILRVNEDRRRDEMLISNQLELHYYHIVGKALHYNRLKLLSTYPNISLVESFDIKNLINTIDKMTLNRVVASINHCIKVDKNYNNLYHIVYLYKEQINFIKILIECNNITYNEYALVALYRIYYNNSDRLDQLPKLVTSWKPGYYQRRYLFVLIELIHETLKTLELTYNKYSNIQNSNELIDKLNQYKKQKKHLKKEIDYEIYLSACIGFNPKEYFKKLVTNHIILLYTKLLNEYKILDQVVVYYIYCFYQRLCLYPLDQQYPINHLITNQSSDNITSDPVEGLTLLYMLFNIQSLVVFNNLLNDSTIYSIKYYQPLIKLIKLVVRKFFELSSKNHLLYVEILFLHSHPHNHCELIDNVYEAASYLSYTNTSKDLTNDLTSSDNNDDKNTINTLDFNQLDSQVTKKINKFIDDDEEFDDQIIFSNDLKFNKSNQSIKRKKKLVNSSSQSDESNNDEELSDKIAKKRSRVKFVSWTDEEDQILREQYDIYVGTSSVFTMIAENDQLKNIGNNRSVKHIEKRIQELKLHLKATNKDALLEQIWHDSSDDEDSSNDNSNSKSKLIISPIDSLTSHKSEIDSDDEMAAKLFTNKSTKRLLKSKMINTWDGVDSASDVEDMFDGNFDTNNKILKKRTLAIDSDDDL